MASKNHLIPGRSYTASNPPRCLDVNCDLRDIGACFDRLVPKLAAFAIPMSIKQIAKTLEDARRNSKDRNGTSRCAPTARALKNWEKREREDSK